MKRFGPLLVLGFATVCRLSRAAQVVETDICVYGGTSGGVAAAVAAARLGKSVVLLSLNNHVGGMTATGKSCAGPGGAVKPGGNTR